MNRWTAMTMAADFRQGGRFYIFEAMHSPDLPRPPYMAGDVIDIDQTNGPNVGGSIDVLSGRSFEATFDGVRLQFSPTPRGYPAPSIRTDIPFEDYVAHTI